MAPRTNSPSNKSHRGEPVIKAVLDATRDELVRVGYRALRIEDVASRANVNKTTVYRRWPTKPDLVHDTLRGMFGDHLPEPNTGCLRGDLLVVAGSMLEFLRSADGQVLVRLMMMEGSDHELREIVEAMRSEKAAVSELVIESAKARGELRADVQTELMMSMLIGGLHHRIFALCISSTEIDIEQHVDLLLYGAVEPAQSRTSKCGFAGPAPGASPLGRRPRHRVRK